MNAALALTPVIVLLAAGLAALLITRVLRLSPIVGFLIAGVVIAQFGIGVEARDGAAQLTDMTQLLAELGVVFLLFDIGLHFSLKDAKAQRRDLLTLAPAQMAITGGAFALAAYALGVPIMLAIIIGGGLALSSTAVVVRILAERNLPTCPLGRSTTAILVFQDIVGIFLLVFAHALSDADASIAQAVGEAALKATVAAVAAITIGRFVATPAFRVLAAARNEEAFPAAALLLVLATAAATGAAGLSLTLGSFLAGMIIAETPYKHVIQTEVRPFRSLLLGFFFMTVGMQLDIAALMDWRTAGWVLVGVAALMIGKTALTFIAARVSGWSSPGAVQLSFLIAQGSEFLLVILAVAAVSAALGPDVVTAMIAVVAVSLALTPAWSGLGMGLARRLAERGARASLDAEAEAAAPARPVVVFGLTPLGRLSVDALRAHDLPYLAVENDPDRFAAAQADGYDAAFGDAADMRFMDTVGMAHARAVVVGQPVYEVARDLTPYVRERFPDLERFTATSDAVERNRHAALGFRVHVLEEDVPGLSMTVDLLLRLGADPIDVAGWEQDVRTRHEPDDEDVIEPAAA